MHGLCGRNTQVSEIYQSFNKQTRETSSSHETTRAIFTCPLTEQCNTTDILSSRQRSWGQNNLCLIHCSPPPLLSEFSYARVSLSEFSFVTLPYIVMDHYNIKTDTEWACVYISLWINSATPLLALPTASLFSLFDEAQRVKTDMNRVRPTHG